MNRRKSCCFDGCSGVACDLQAVSWTGRFPWTGLLRNSDPEALVRAGQSVEVHTCPCQCSVVRLRKAMRRHQNQKPIECSGGVRAPLQSARQLASRNHVYHHPQCRYRGYCLSLLPRSASCCCSLKAVEACPDSSLPCASTKSLGEIVACCGMVFLSRLRPETYPHEFANYPLLYYPPSLGSPFESSSIAPSCYVLLHRPPITTRQTTTIPNPE